jgi:hypothetical protein
MFEGIVNINVKDISQLKEIISKIAAIAGIRTVDRYENQ